LTPRLYYKMIEIVKKMKEILQKLVTNGKEKLILYMTELIIISHLWEPYIVKLGPSSDRGLI